MEKKRELPRAPPSDFSPDIDRKGVMFCRRKWSREV